VVAGEAGDRAVPWSTASSRARASARSRCGGARYSVAAGRTKKVW